MTPKSLNLSWFAPQCKWKRIFLLLLKQNRGLYSFFSPEQCMKRSNRSEVNSWNSVGTFRSQNCWKLFYLWEEGGYKSEDKRNGIEVNAEECWENQSLGPFWQMVWEMAGCISGLARRLIRLCLKHFSAHWFHLPASLCSSVQSAPVVQCSAPMGPVELR